MSKEKKLKKGDRVIMVDCGEAEHYAGKVWECTSDSYADEAGQSVVFLEGFAGCFLCSCLKQLKTVVLTIRKTFMKGHPRADDPTNFPELIEKLTKKHTIRAGDYWRKVVLKVNAGTHFLSVRTWDGRAYVDKGQTEVAAYTKLGYQTFEFKFLSGQGAVTPLVDNRVVDPDNLIDLAANDGLTSRDFLAWFEYPKPFTGGIIHFTDFRYWQQPGYFISNEKK